MITDYAVVSFDPVVMRKVEYDDQTIKIWHESGELAFSRKFENKISVPDVIGLLAAAMYGTLE